MSRILTLAVVLALTGCAGTLQRPVDTPAEVSRAPSATSGPVARPAAPAVEPGVAAPPVAPPAPAESGAQPAQFPGAAPNATAGMDAQGTGWMQSGIASWYGPGFQGRRTANGERFDTHQLTAAHKTLPFGTRVRVKSMVNGKEIIVRINDRGPFIAGRIIDLSYAAAQAIGMAGVKQVLIERLK